MIATTDCAPTNAQLATTHPYADEFTNRIAWAFENIHALFGEKFDPEDFDTLRHNFGQNILNSGHKKIADAWAAFAARKLVEAVLNKSIDLAASHIRGEISANEAVGALVKFSGNRVSTDYAIRMLTKAVDSI